MDVVAILLILGMRARFQRRMRKYEDKYDAKIVEINDYTVLVTGLPHGEDEEVVETGLRRCARHP